MPELRKDPVIGRWVIISTERAKRPMDFAAAKDQVDSAEQCPFCEGRESLTPPEIYAVRPKDSSANGPGWNVRVIPSIKPILRIEGQPDRRAKGMYDVMNGIGAHEVIVEDPHHVADLSQLPVERIRDVLQATIHRMIDLERDARFRYVLWFKNAGLVAGAGRISHTRSQLIATPVTPKRVKEELVGTRRYYEDKERCLFCDIINQERQTKERVVFESERIIVLCPFASRFPFELSIFPKRHHCDFHAMTPEEVAELAVAMKQVLGQLNTILNNPPYNYLLHGAPLRRLAKATKWKSIEDDYHWHLELIPRLTRVAGFEWGSGFYINPTPPEEAAKYLRDAIADGQTAAKPAEPPSGGAPQPPVGDASQPAKAGTH